MQQNRILISLSKQKQDGQTGDKHHLLLVLWRSEDKYEGAELTRVKEIKSSQAVFMLLFIDGQSGFSCDIFAMSKYTGRRASNDCKYLLETQKLKVGENSLAWKSRNCFYMRSLNLLQL